MANTQQMMGVELRFRPLPDAVIWTAVFTALWDWEPRLVPSHVDRLTDLEVEEPEPWSDSQQATLAQRLAQGRYFSWLLFREDDEETGMQILRRQSELELSIRAPRPDEDAAKGLLRLLALLEGTALPALVMVYAGGSKDAELAMQGLHGLQDVPPLLYLDEWAIDRVGGRVAIRRLPIPAHVAPGGLLLVVRPDPWQPSTAEERARIKVIRQQLGISPEHPLVFAPSPGWGFAAGEGDSS